MATADEYAAWIVANADKKGTPDFETVAQAYREARAAPAPEEKGLLGAANVPLLDPLFRFGKGAVGATEDIVSAFGGPETAPAEWLRSGEKFMERLVSAQSRQDAKEQARIMKEAEDKGIGAQVAAAWEALKVAPIDTLSEAAGSVVPSLLARGARSIVGGVQSMGSTKSDIYNAVRDEFVAQGFSEEEAAKAADRAQSYSGENLDQILLSGAIGAVAAGVGLEPAVGRLLSKNITQRLAATSAAKGLGRGIATEALPEAGQAAQQQFAQNLALQREGFDVPLGRGVAGAAALEGMAGGVLGGGIGAIEGATYRAPPAPEPTAEPGAEEELGFEILENVPVDRGAVLSGLYTAAGPTVPPVADARIKTLERKVSGSLGINTPETLQDAMAYIDQQEAAAKAGVDFGEDVATPYLGALSEARRIIGEAVSRLPKVEETDDGVAGPYVRGGEPSVPSPDGAGAVRGAPEETEAAAPPGVEAAGRLAEPDIGRTGAGEPPLGAEQAPPAAPAAPVVDTTPVVEAKTRKERTKAATTIVETVAPDAPQKTKNIAAQRIVNSVLKNEPVDVPSTVQTVLEEAGGDKVTHPEPVVREEGGGRFAVIVGNYTFRGTGKGPFKNRKEAEAFAKSRVGPAPEVAAPEVAAPEVAAPAPEPVPEVAPEPAPEAVAPKVAPKVPPVPEGYVRLYRAEAPPEQEVEGQKKVPEWKKTLPGYQQAMKAASRWFTDDPEEASWYVQNEYPEGRVVYVDVPATEVEKYRVSNIPLKTSADPEVRPSDIPDNPQAFSRRPEKEFYIPTDLAAKRKDYTEPLEAAPRLTPAPEPAPAPKATPTPEEMAFLEGAAPLPGGEPAPAVQPAPTPAPEVSPAPEAVVEEEPEPEGPLTYATIGTRIENAFKRGAITPGVRDILARRIGRIEADLLEGREPKFSPQDIADALEQHLEGFAPTLQNLAPNAFRGYEGGERPRKQQVRANQRFTKLNKLFADGWLTPTDYVEQASKIAADMAQAAEDKAFEKEMTPRKRGADIVRERLLEFSRKGELDPGDVEFALWAIGKNPAMAQGLAISVIQTPKGKEHAAGDYNPLSAVMRIFKRHDAAGTEVHEILHHTERMMPERIQRGIADAWGRAYAKAPAKSTGKQREALQLILPAVAGDRAAQEALLQAFEDGVLDRDVHYQLVNPSEFWAVNATRILGNRYDVATSRRPWVRAARQWLSEFVERAKGWFGLRSDSAILAGLREVLATEGLPQASRYRSITDVLGGRPATQLENIAPAPTTPASTTEPLKAANSWITRYADAFGMGPVFDAWVKGWRGDDVLPEDLATAGKLERLFSSMAGRVRNLDRNYKNPIIQEIKRLNVDLDDLDLFLRARAAKDRNQKIAEINAAFPDGGSGLLTAEAARHLQRFREEGKIANLNRVARKIDALVDHTLAEKVAAGLLTEEQAAAERAKEPFYVPLKGFAEDDDLTADTADPSYEQQRAKERETARNASMPVTSVREFRRAYGRESRPFHPLFNLFQDAEQMVRRNVRNEAALPLIRLWKQNPSMLEGLVDVYIDREKPKRIQTSYDVPERRTQPVSSMLREYYDNPDKYLMVKDKGVAHFVEFKNTEGGQALKRMYANMQPETLTGFFGTMAKINNFLKGMLTYKNPVYLTMVAPLRDISAAVATAMHNQNVKGSPAYKKNLALLTAKYAVSPTTWSTISRYVFGKAPLRGETERLLQQMLREGGAPLHNNFMDVQARAQEGLDAIRELKGVDFFSPKDQSARLWQGLNRWLDGLGDTVDMVARFATYRAATELGITPTDAASLALDSSLNLTRRGELARKMDLIVPFFGAGIEGSRKLWHFSKNPKTLLKVGGALIAYGVVESLINSAVGGDSDDDGREDYLDQDLNAKRRLSRAVIFYGDQPEDYISVPIDPMLGLFKYIGNRIGDIMAGNTTTPDATASIMEAGLDIGAGAFAVMSPLRVPGTDVQSLGVALTPLVGKPIMENIVNENFFGSPVYKERGFNMAPASELGREATGEGWKILARAINQFTGGNVAVRGAADFQPEVYRHMIESWLGGPYQLAKQIVALPDAEDTSDIPFVKTFVGAGSEFVPQSKYYQNTDVIRQIMNRASKLTPEQAREVVDKYALETNPLILEAYEEVEKRLDELNEMQKEAIAVAREGSSPDEDIKLVMDYILAEKSKYYSAFNRLYNDAKRGE